MNEPSRTDLDVLEQLEKGTDPSTVPQDAINRLIEHTLVAYRPPGRVMLTGTAKELLLRRQYGLPLPAIDTPENGDQAEAEDTQESLD